MLTGNAKLHFDVWAKQHPDINYNEYTGVLKVGNEYLSRLPDCVKHVFVLEWLDSVGIYISVIPVVPKIGEHYYFSEITYRHNQQRITWSSSRIPTRQSAKEVAIINAVKIYNET